MASKYSLNRIVRDNNPRYLTAQGDINKRFDYRTGIMTQEASDRIAAIAEEAKGFAKFLCLNCPSSHELSNALDKLQEVSMWATNAITSNEMGTVGAQEKNQQP